MAKIVRYNGNLVPFASSSLGTERTIFGQVTQANDITSQFTAEFLRGWGIVGPSDQPTLQDFNAVSYTHGQILAYLHQVGVAEWNALQEYHVGSVTNSSGILYISLVNTNIGNIPLSSATQWAPLVPSFGTTGSVSRGRMSIAAASATATFTADEITVKGSLGGTTNVLSFFNKNINLATVGVGGMDTGAAPVSGAVGIYAIYNPSLPLSATNPALLAQNASVSAVAEVYGGANMPAGYTRSALVSVRKTNASGQFLPGEQDGRRVTMPITAPLSTSVQQVTYTALSLNPAVPPNAKTCSGMLAVGSTSAGVTSTLAISPSAAGTGEFQAGIGNGPANVTTYANFPDLILPVPQTLYYKLSSGGPILVGNINITAYTF